MEAAPVHGAEFFSTRSPQLGALLSRFFFGWEGTPFSCRPQKKVGTLILTSLLEDLVKVVLLGGYASNVAGLRFATKQIKCSSSHLLEWNFPGMPIGATCLLGRCGRGFGSGWPAGWNITPTYFLSPVSDFELGPF